METATPVAGTLAYWLRPVEVTRMPHSARMKVNSWTRLRSCARDYWPARWQVKRSTIWTRATLRRTLMRRSPRVLWKLPLEASIFLQVRVGSSIHLDGLIVQQILKLMFCFADMPKNTTTMDSRGEYRFGHSSSSPSHSPTKESLKNSER